MSSTPSYYRTPVQNGLNNLRQRLEYQLKQKLDSDHSVDKTSPTLEKLRSTPGRVSKDKETLISKHLDARQNVDKLSVGGGISLWPNMDDMRLKKREAIQLCIICCLLFWGVVLAFYKLHGHVIHKLLHFHQRLKKFVRVHKITMDQGPAVFKDSVLVWHQGHMTLLEEIHTSFDVSKFPLTYIMYICVYGVGMGTLVYYLADNVWSKNKLSPRRIKKWTCLLTVIGTWTVALTYMLACAYRVETDIQQNVGHIAQVMGVAITTDLDLSTLSAVVEYWRTRCLTPSAGTLSIMGIVEVRDVLFYLQYYLVPVMTVLGTPVVKLVVSLYNVYYVSTDNSGKRYTGASC